MGVAVNHWLAEFDPQIRSHFWSITMKIFVVFIVLVSLAGCGKLEQWWSHKKSDVFGLDRTATLYSDYGTQIKQWTFDSKVEEGEISGSSRFIVKGKAVVVNGGILVIEEQ